MIVVKTINEYDNNDFYRLYDNSWGGAIQTLDDICNNNLQEEFMALLNDYFYEEEIEDTTLNDFIWFDRDTIYKDLGLNENGEKEEEEEE